MVVDAVPVVAVFAHQGSLEPLGLLRLAIGLHASDLEARVAVGIGAVGAVDKGRTPTSALLLRACAAVQQARPGLRRKRWFY